MRSKMLISFAAIALTACGGSKSAQDSSAPEQSAADDSLATNDVTAIDAATGEAANMAADVNYTINNMVTDNSAATAPSSRHRQAAPVATNATDNAAIGNDT